MCETDFIWSRHPAVAAVVVWAALAFGSGCGHADEPTEWSLAGDDGDRTAESETANETSADSAPRAHDRRHFVQVSAGREHACAVTRAGDAYCWGDAQEGEASPPRGDFREVSAGSVHTCAIEEDGEATCWGHGSAAEAPEGRFETLAAFSNGSCGVARGGELRCWGPVAETADVDEDSTYRNVASNEQWICGLTEGKGIECTWTPIHHRFAQVPSGQFRDVDVGNHRLCGVLESGEVLCWGYSEDRVRRRPAEGDYVSVTVGGDNASGYQVCARTAAGGVDCWGRNDHGQADAPDREFEQVSAGGRHTCGVTERGRLRCWGELDLEL